MSYPKLLMLFLSLSIAVSLTAQTDKGLKIMRTYQEALGVDDLKSEVAYKNTSRKGKVQERNLYQYIKKNGEGKNKYNFLLQFTAPLDIKGAGTLTWQHVDKKDDQWLFLPAIRTARRISPSRKTDRFMGTEITFEDLSNYLSEPLEKYTYQYLGQKERDGAACHVIEARPADDDEKAESGYSRRELWITTDHLVNIYTLFYDKKGEKLKTYRAWNIKKVPGSAHYRPYNAKMSNLQSGNTTEVFYADIRINTGIPDETFTKSNLETLD